MQKITPFLWFDNNSEQAVKHYTSIFKKSKILNIARHTAASAKATGHKAGSVMVIDFELNGQRFTAMNGGPVYKFNPSISFFVECKTQAELDHYWKKLSAGGKEVQCGWLEDKFGVSWQIVPEKITEWLASKNPEKSARVMEAVMQMVKLDIKKLKAAYDGKKK